MPRDFISPTSSGLKSQTGKLTASLTNGITRKLTGAELEQLFLEKFKLTVSDTERITNNFFSNTSGWGVSEPSTTGISGGKMVLNNATSGEAFYFDNATEEGKSYEVKFIISDYSSGGIRIRFPEDTDRVYNANGNYTAIITANTSSNATRLLFTIVGTTTLKVDNVFVKEVSQKPPIAAFSLRKLGNVSPYACRIRRSSDNTEAQVMFDASDRVSESSVVRNTSMNIIPQSENFGSWSNARTTATLSTETDPFGGNNSWLVTQTTASGGSGSIFSGQSVTSGKYYTLSVYAKKKNKDFIVLYDTNFTRTYFNLANGTVGTVGATQSDAKITAIGSDGWYRVSTVFKATSTGTQNVAFYLADSNNSTTVTANDGVYLFGAQLEEATTYEAVGTEKVTDGGFDNPSVNWTSRSSSVSVSLGQAGFISSAENDFLQQNIGAVNGRKYKVTVTVTDHTAGAIAVRYPINKTASVHHINSVGTHTIEGVADQNNVNIQFQAKGASTTLTIDNLSVLEHKPIPSKYISTPVVSNDGLTFTESTLNTFVGGENLIIRSTYTIGQSGTSWNAGTTLSEASSTETSPTGSQDAFKLLETATTQEHAIVDYMQMQPSQTYVFSTYIKSVGGRNVKLFTWQRNASNTMIDVFFAAFDLTNGTVISDQTSSGLETSISDEGNDWYRISMKFTTSANVDTSGSYLGALRINVAQTNGSHSAYAGDTTKGIIQWGAQLNTASLKTFQATTGTLRDGNASVVILYNQTGGEDIIQPVQETSSRQPLLYKGAKLVKANASPAIQFDGTDDVMKFSPDEFGNGLNLNSLSSFLVFKADNISGFDYVFNLGTATNDKDWFLPFINSGNFVVRYGTNSNSGTTGNTNVNLFSGVAGLQSGKFKAFLNGTQTDIRDVENNSSDTGIASVGGLEGTSNQFEGKILEIIVFDTEQHTTREAIEADIADFHNITLS